MDNPLAPCPQETTSPERAALRPCERMPPRCGCRPIHGALDGGSWGGWHRNKMAIATLLVTLLIALLAILTKSNPEIGAGVVTSLEAPVVVVWQPPGQTGTRMTMVETARWQAYVASRTNEKAALRQEIVNVARAEIVANLAPVFDEMKGRVKDFVGWFYFFPTTYRMAFTAVTALLTREAGDERSMQTVATDALSQLLRDRFVEVVVLPSSFGPAVIAKERIVLAHAIEREQAAAAKEDDALAKFMVSYGHPVEGEVTESNRQVVLARDALGVPPTVEAMAAPPDPLQIIKSDLSLNRLHTGAITEGLMLMARQIARRAVHSAVSQAANAAILPMVVGSAFGPMETLVSPAIGIAAFGVGVGAEFGTIKLREMFESDQLTKTSESVVESLREDENRGLADGLAQRIETWLGGSG